MGHSNESRTVEYTDKHGYRICWAPNHPRAPKGWIASHILIAEKALGKELPFGAEVHHVDENKANNLNTNLVICEDKSYHGLLHRRQRVLQVNGNPDIQKICCSCNELRFLHQFNRRSRSPDGLREDCIFCVSVKNSKRIR